MATINVVPYIDVMLVLLIIFMITTPLLEQGVEVELPQTQADPIEVSQDKSPVIVSVDAAGDYFLSYGEYRNEPVDGERLRTLVAAISLHQSDVQVLVNGDHRVPYGRVVTAMSELQAAGVPNVGLLTEAIE
ncbi:MAG: protein TolR [Gammaproteobacteria bacterium]|nr:protein TolR [Gammaproteobacteria bacterium]